MDIEPGTVVANRYRISRAIGRGGMGEVFAAENIRTGRPVAVKLLRADSKTKSSAVERFRREARAAGSINSDHVTQVLDVEDDSEHGIVIVFELLEGESLIDRLKRTGPIPFEELHPIIEEVWVGLSDAHKAGIIHRDLKPSNVFLERRPDGQLRVKLLDFGISKLPKEMGGETLTEMGQSLGTFSFMPPEQIGRAKTVDHRADIYAATTMIYQSLTGQLPYNARNILVMVELKSKTNPRPLSEALGVPVDEQLEAFIAKGLARNPADRFQNALEALERWRDLKQLDVPASRRAAISSMDLNAQARLASTPASPLPAAGRPASSVPPVRVHTSPFQTGAAPMAAPAPVVPAGMLEPVMPGSLPRLYDQTEVTTDVSRVEVVHPLSMSTEASGTQPTAQAVQEAQQVAARAGNDAPERRGPAGTRVMPPSVVQEAVALAEARKASSSQGDLRAVSQSAQAYRPQGAPGPSGYSPPATPPQGMPYTPTATPSSPMQAIPRAHQGGHPQAQAGARPISHPDLRGAPGSAQPHPGSAAPGSGIHPVGPSGWGVASQPGPPTTNPSHVSSSSQMLRMPTPPPPSSGAGSVPPASPVAQSGMRMASQPPMSPHGAPPGGQVSIQTMRMPDEPSSIPASQDKTTVYRPKKKAVEKKPNVLMYVFGALAFAVVGFGIVYVVQLIVRSLP